MRTAEEIGYFVLTSVLSAAVAAFTWGLLFLLLYKGVYVYGRMRDFIKLRESKERGCCSPVKFLRTAARRLRGCWTSVTENSSGDFGSLRSRDCCSPARYLRTAAKKLGRYFFSSTEKPATTGVENAIPATSTGDILAGQRPPSPPVDEPTAVPAASPAQAAASVDKAPPETVGATRHPSPAVAPVAAPVAPPRRSRCKSTQTDFSDDAGHRVCSTPPPSDETALSVVIEHEV